MTAISRQPMRVDSKSSRNAIVVPATTGAASAASNVQTTRIVDSPPLPGGNESPAWASCRGTAEPSTVSTRPPDTDSHAARRAAAVSAADSTPSPSTSKACFAWNAGISASSMTASTSTRDGSTRIPA